MTTAEAFLKACEDVRAVIQGIDGWAARLALTICLAECIVGNSENDEPDEAMRLAQTMRALGDIVGDMLAGDDGEENPQPSPPFPDLLRKLLERRRGGAKH